MKIKIIKCDEPEAWYSNQVGEVFEVHAERSDCYYVDEHRYTYVLKEDAEIVGGDNSE